MQFEVEKKQTMGKPVITQKTKELIMQIEAMEKFYGHLGINTENCKKIFTLMLNYLKGKIDKMEIKSFFDVLMQRNKILNEKELNLLICFDGLVDVHTGEDPGDADDLGEDYLNVA